MATHGEIRWPPTGTSDGRVRGVSDDRRRQALLRASDPSPAPEDGRPPKRVLGHVAHALHARRPQLALSSSPAPSRPPRWRSPQAGRREPPRGGPQQRGLAHARLPSEQLGGLWPARTSAKSVSRCSRSRSRITSSDARAAAISRRTLGPVSFRRSVTLHCDAGRISGDTARGDRAQAETTSNSEAGSARASCRRDWIPSLVNTWCRCHSTVRALRKRQAPISAFESPSRASSAI
jgi:hypothetical protein